MSFFLIALLAVVTSTQQTAAQTYSNSDCRCLAGQSCFPTADQWDAFNQTIGGRLINPRPTAYPCFPASFDAASCSALEANPDLPAFRVTLPGTMQSWNWEELDSQRCPLEIANVTNAQCSQGRVPTYGINATSVDDIQKGLAFAIQHNLRVQVKNSGHDYLGRSTSPGSFMIWTHSMRDMIVNESWSPANCPQVTARPAITLGPGATWGEIHPLLDAQNKYILPGGYTFSVGASGGYFMGGGGHSMLSPTYGLAVDNLLEIQVLTADGQLHVTNQCQNPDLFWALKGGGPGTYGIVTFATYQLQPAPTDWTGFIIYVVPAGGATLTFDQFADLMTVYAQQGPMIDAARWGGYWEGNRQIGFIATIILPVSMAVANQTITTFTNAFRPMEQAGLVTIKTNVTKWSSFWDWRKNHKWPGPLDIDFTGFRGVLGSRLIPMSALKDPATLGRNIAATVEKSNFIVGLLVAGQGVRERDTLSQNSAASPGWRTAFMHIVFLSVWDFNTTDTQIDQIGQNLEAGVANLTLAYPDSGTYMNEAYLVEDYKQQFWGMDNFNRLLGIKKQVDPNGVFACTQCVGSDDWSSDGNCRVHKGGSYH